LGIFFKTLHYSLLRLRVQVTRGGGWGRKRRARRIGKGTVVAERKKGRGDKREKKEKGKNH
jgi:hypothetical protein